LERLNATPIALAVQWRGRRAAALVAAHSNARRAAKRHRENRGALECAATRGRIAPQNLTPADTRYVRGC